MADNTPQWSGSSAFLHGFARGDIEGPPSGNPSTWWGSAKLALPEGVTQPHVHVPLLVVNYTRDVVIFPDRLQEIVDHAGTKDISVVEIDSDHYGLPASGTGEDVIKQVSDAITSWLATHE